MQLLSLNKLRTGSNDCGNSLQEYCFGSASQASYAALQYYFTRIYFQLHCALQRRSAPHRSIASFALGRGQAEAGLYPVGSGTAAGGAGKNLLGYTD